MPITISASSRHLAQAAWCKGPFVLSLSKDCFVSVQLREASITRAVLRQAQHERVLVGDSDFWSLVLAQDRTALDSPPRRGGARVGDRGVAPRWHRCGTSPPGLLHHGGDKAAQNFCRLEPCEDCKLIQPIWRKPERNLSLNPAATGRLQSSGGLFRRPHGGPGRW